MSREVLLCGALFILCVHCIITTASLEQYEEMDKGFVSFLVEVKRKSTSQQFQIDSLKKSLEIVTGSLAENAQAFADFKSASSDATLRQNRLILELQSKFSALNSGLRRESNSNTINPEGEEELFGYGGEQMGLTRSNELSHRSNRQKTIKNVHQQQKPVTEYSYLEKEFLLIMDPKTFDEAVKACSDRNLRLVQIDDKATNDYIYDVVVKPNSVSLWLGATNSVGSPIFKWLDGSDLTYSYSDGFSEDTYERNGIFMNSSSGKWIAHATSNHVSVLCEQVNIFALQKKVNLLEQQKGTKWW